MWPYILRRILYMIPILFGVTLVTFILFNIVGQNPALLQAGRYATPEIIKSLEHELGLDLPLHEQYFFYVKQILTLDFGRSWSTKQQITTMLADGIGASLSFAIPAFSISLILSILIALLAAYLRGTTLDKGIMVVCLAAMSFPSLVTIIAFQYFFGYELGWFPISGYDSSWDGRWYYLILSIIIWVMMSFGAEVLFYRSVIIEEVYQDYVRTAKAKGLSAPVIFLKHVLKNALIPILTLVVISIPFLYTGSLLLESFFSIPGLGGMLVKAIQSSDFPVIKAMTFIGACLYVVFSLISDILNAFVDPRIKLG